MILGIDASNIRVGGGVHHLVELLRVADPKKHNFEKIYIWGGNLTLSQIEDRNWLVKNNLRELDAGIIRRSIWQRFELCKIARIVGCNVLFIPGGSFYGGFNPVISMSQNLLPFEWKEIRRYGWSMAAIRLFLLRLTQSRTFRLSDGVIFLTRYAQSVTNKVVKLNSGKMALVAHGVNQRFEISPRLQHGIERFTEENPFRILYVSTVDVYKHQWNVVEAVAKLRNRGYPVSLDMVGHGYPRSLLRLNKALAKNDPDGKFINYVGALPYESLHQMYAVANMGVFASSCETFGQIVTESMSAGLPIACSELSAMQELLGTAAVYFDPEKPDSIASAIQKLIQSPELREEKSREAFDSVKKYTWNRCAEETFAFLNSTLKIYDTRAAIVK